MINKDNLKIGSIWRIKEYSLWNQLVNPYTYMLIGKKKNIKYGEGEIYTWYNYIFVRIEDSSIPINPEDSLFFETLCGFRLNEEYHTKKFKYLYMFGD